jgi:hypothetical protein
MNPNHKTHLDLVIPLWPETISPFHHHQFFKSSISYQFRVQISSSLSLFSSFRYHYDESSLAILVYVKKKLWVVVIVFLKYFFWVVGYSTFVTKAWRFWVFFLFFYWFSFKFYLKMPSNTIISLNRCKFMCN